MRFKKLMAEEACVALADIICNFVPDDRSTPRADLALLIAFMGNFSESDEKTKALLRAGLSVKRPKATINGAISMFRKSLESEDCEPLVADLFDLCMALSTSGSKERNFTFFVGKVLGVDEPKIRKIADNAYATVIPKRL